MGTINIAAWMKEFRVRFLLFVTLPVILGSAIAYAYFPGQFSLFYFVLAAAAMMLLHAGTIIINDYFDYVSGTDVVNQSRTPYSGGSGMLPDKILKPGHVLAASLLCFAVCIVLGLFIVATRSTGVLLIGVAGVWLGLAYTVPPFRLAYRGLGELARLIATPLIVLGAFLVQIPLTSGPGVDVAWPAIFACLAASVPVALLNTAALYIFEFPDYEADRQTGKRNLVVRLGPQKATSLFIAMHALTYLSLAMFVMTRHIPWVGLAAFLLLPASAYATAGLVKTYADARRLVPYMKAASGTYIAGSAIIALAFLL
ncbi:MAG: 1,4-dihydroxy-2-naphthoate octaprenyltransferase [Methanocella sp. PtaU1.Bin125]|nr:MAG: 1,4-dihydroxy-2-naphthoate octaprenyltransferase [Methanocella sp. PtaU1.Bin125]